jgi:hypothetical protein
MKNNFVTVHLQESVACPCFAYGSRLIPWYLAGTTAYAKRGSWRTAHMPLRTSDHANVCNSIV